MDSSLTLEVRTTPPPPPPSQSLVAKPATTAYPKIPPDILDDLASRFIINVPDDERNDFIRICFQIELAHWFYLDFFCCIEDKKLVPCGLKQFAEHLFQHIPFLRMHLPKLDDILDNWKQYKMSVPTFGAILMSEGLEYVLLVQSYWAKSSWGFPKGKVNEHEDPVHCATREVFEETGYDITELIVPTQYIDSKINDQYTRLYLVQNVPLKTLFTPRTRKEIKDIEWFPINSLPVNKNDMISKINLGINPNSFFMIMPFVKRLKKWVQDNKSGVIEPKYRNYTKRIDTKTFVYGNLPSSSISADKRKSKGKRYRHLSLGDIDGIKVIDINNMSASKSFYSATSTSSGATVVAAGNGGIEEGTTATVKTTKTTIGNGYENDNEICTNTSTITTRITPNNNNNNNNNNHSHSHNSSFSSSSSSSITNSTSNAEYYVKTNYKRQTTSIKSCSGGGNILKSSSISCTTYKGNSSNSSSNITDLKTIEDSIRCTKKNFNNNSSATIVNSMNNIKTKNIKTGGKQMYNGGNSLHHKLTNAKQLFGPCFHSWREFTFKKNSIVNVFG